MPTMKGKSKGVVTLLQQDCHEKTSSGTVMLKGVISSATVWADVSVGKTLVL